MENFLIKTGFFLLGIVLVQELAGLPNHSVLFLAAVVLLLSIKSAKWLACFLFGVIWASVYAGLLLDQQLPKSLEGKELLLQGKVLGLPVQHSDAVRFLFKVESLNNKEIADFPSKIRLSWYGRFNELKSGESWQLLVKLKRPHGTANPHGFDAEKWMFLQGVGATGYVRSTDKNSLLQKNQLYQLGYWRESLRAYLNKSLKDSEHLGVVKALVLGDRSGISQSQWNVFRLTGTSHLVAISGLHIGLVSGLFFTLFKWLASFFRTVITSPRKFALIVSVLAAAGYAALAGFSIPTQRALVMVIAVVAALYWQRYCPPSRVIAIALWAVLIVDPLAVLSAGFWLSFSAVAIISYGLQGRVGQTGFFKGLIKTQWYVSLGLMPVVLYFFKQASLISPLANIVAVPLVSLLLVPLLLLSLLLGLISQQLGALAWRYVDTVMDALWWFLSELATIDMLQWSLMSVSVEAALLAMIAVILLLAPRNTVFTFLALLLLLPLLFPIKEPPLNEAEFDLLMLDVGQGLSLIVQTKNHTLVFDTGAKYNQNSDVASMVVLPYLKGVGISTIDKLIVSHADNDHAGGVASVINGLKVAEIQTSNLGLIQPALGERIGKNCIAGDSWRWDGVLFEFIHPSKYQIFKGNDASCVLKVSSAFGSALLPGDIEKAAEASLLRFQRNKLDVDVLVAPHHGSSSSSTEGFIKASSPEIVLYPVGYLNRYQFPKKEVVERYQRIKAQSFESASAGAVLVKFRELAGIKVQKYREKFVRYWQWQK